MTIAEALPAGSVPWLLAHEVRLAWRGLAKGKAARRRGLVLTLVFAVVCAVVGVPVGLLLRGVAVPLTPLSALIADVALACVLTLMLSATLASSAEAFYTRGDLDLLLSAPLPAERVLVVRALAIAVNVFVGTAVFITPLLLPVALIAHPAWLAAYGVLAAVALWSTAVGLLLAMVLFRLIGPRRTRAVAQVLAAIIGAAVFLISQFRNFLDQAQLGRMADAVVADVAQNGETNGLMFLPQRALMGDAVLVAALLGSGTLVFLAVAQWVGRGFAADAAAANGAATAGRAPDKVARPFVGGAFAATFTKEARLLARDIPLLSQVLLRLLYLLPVTFLALRAAASHTAWTIPGLVGAMTFMSGQAMGSLAWVTLSAEDAPDLIAAAPASPDLIRRAKITAALAPLAVLLTVPLLVLTAISPMSGIAGFLGCAGCSVAVGLLHAWRQRPSKRADFRRRGTTSWTVNLAELFLCLLCASAASLAAIGWALAVVPATLACAALLALRRDDAAIARANATA